MALTPVEGGRPQESVLDLTSKLHYAMLTTSSYGVRQVLSRLKSSAQVKDLETIRTIIQGITIRILHIICSDKGGEERERDLLPRSPESLKKVTLPLLVRLGLPSPRSPKKVTLPLLCTELTCSACIYKQRVMSQIPNAEARSL